MKKSLDKLINKYGTIKRVAEVLGVTRRTIEKANKGQKIGAPLIKLIKTKARLIDIEDI